MKKYYLYSKQGEKQKNGYSSVILVVDINKCKKIQGFDYGVSKYEYEKMEEKKKVEDHDDVKLEESMDGYMETSTDQYSRGAETKKMREGIRAGGGRREQRGTPRINTMPS